MNLIKTLMKAQCLEKSNNIDVYKATILIDIRFIAVFKNAIVFLTSTFNEFYIKEITRYKIVIIIS
jgi:hypothetical protein